MYCTVFMFNNSLVVCIHVYEIYVNSPLWPRNDLTWLLLLRKWSHFLKGMISSPRVCYIWSKSWLSLQLFKNVHFRWSVIYSWFSNNTCSFRMILFCFHLTITFVLKYIPPSFLSIYWFFIVILLFWIWYIIDGSIIFLIVTFEYVEFQWILQQRYDFSPISPRNTFSLVFFIAILLASFCMVSLSPSQQTEPSNAITIPIGRKQHPKLWQYALNILIHSSSPFILLFLFFRIQHQINVQ